MVRTVTFNATALARGIRLRCPACGAGRLFTSYYTVRERCAGCGLRFEREAGYWLGAMWIALAVTELLFAGWFIGGMVVTWPDVAWTTLLVGGIALNVVVPTLGYRWAKTIWMGLHYAFVPADITEAADAIAAHDAARSETHRE